MPRPKVYSIVPRPTVFAPECPIPIYTPLILPQITEFVPPVSHPKVYSIDCAPNYWICTPSVPFQGILHWGTSSNSKQHTPVINNNNSCLQKLMTNSWNDIWGHETENSNQWNEIWAWNWKFQSAFGFGTVCCPSLTGTGRFYPWMLYYIAPAAVTV